VDKINAVLERDLNTKTLKQLYEIKHQQYAEIGYYFDVLSRQRFILQHIDDVIVRKKSEMTGKFKEAGEKRRKNE